MPASTFVLDTGDKILLSAKQNNDICHPTPGDLRLCHVTCRPALSAILPLVWQQIAACLSATVVHISHFAKKTHSSLCLSLSPSLSLSLYIPHTHNHAIFPFFIWCPPCPGYHFPLKSLSDTEWKQQMKVLCTCNSALCQQPFTVCCH